MFVVELKVFLRRAKSSRDDRINERVVGHVVRRRRFHDLARQDVQVDIPSGTRTWYAAGTFPSVSTGFPAKPSQLRLAICPLVHIKIGYDQVLSILWGQGHFRMAARRGNAPNDIGRPFNNLLRRLSASDFALIAPYLAHEEAKADDLLYNPGDDVEIVHFPCGPSLVSYMVSNEDGRDIETILVGREGAVGGIVSQGYLPAYTRIIVKFGGPFVRLHVGKLDAAKIKSVTLRNVFARYADCMLAQMFQSTACNAVHSIEQRMAKWIISAMERTNGEDAVSLTHEQLATMLGVGRSYASRVIQKFKAEGVLETRRGSILVRNREALRIRTCPCNECVKNHFEEVLRGVYPTEEAHHAVEVGAIPPTGG